MMTTEDAGHGGGRGGKRCALAARRMTMLAWSAALSRPGRGCRVARVAVLREVNSGRCVVLPARCLVGRSPACDLVITDKTVSGEHAVVQWTGALWELRDLGSRNGTYLGETRLAAGEAAPIAPAARLRFGREARAWEVADLDAPALMAVNVQTGEIRRADGGYLVLPDGESAEHCVYQDSQESWITEHRGEPRSLEDRAVLTTGDGGRWRVHLPTTLPGTLKDGDAALLVAGLRLRFAVSLDEEHVELVAFSGERRLDMQARAHHYVLLVLARQRLADEAAGVSLGEQGWIRQDELARMLRMEEGHLNISIHRARTQLGKLGVLDAAALVERRSGSRQVRIGAAQLEIAATGEPA